MREMAKSRARSEVSSSAICGVSEGSIKGPVCS